VSARKATNCTRGESEIASEKQVVILLISYIIPSVYSLRKSEAGLDEILEKLINK